MAATMVASTTLSPVKKLPNEVLGEVFEEYVRMDRSPWCLVLVSEHWKSVALSSPRLWNHISIYKSVGWGLGECKPTTWHIPGQSDPVETVGRRQVCMTEVSFRAALSRSGAMPIHVWYQWRDSSNSNLNGPLLLKIALEKSVAFRIATLFVDPYQDDVIPLIDDLPPNYFPRLRSIGISRPYNVPPPTYIDNLHQTAPYLQKLELHQIEGLSTAPPPVLANIRILRLNSENIRLSIATEIMRHCPRLVEFADHGMGWLFLNSDGEFQPSPYGRNKRSIGDVAQLDLPLLDSVSFTDSTHYASHQMISFPRVTSLRLRLKDITLLRYLDSPNLTELDVRTFAQERGTEFADSFLRGIQFLNVVTLRLQSHFRERFFVELLHSFPTVKSIHLVQTEHRSPFSGHAIFNELMLIDGRAPCRRLEKITLGTDKYRLHLGKVGMENLIDLVLRSREEARLILPRFIIHWCHPTTSLTEVLSLP